MAPVFTRIAVGTDGSDSAMRAVEHSRRLAGALGAELVVVHAYGRQHDEGAPVGTREMGASLLRDVGARHGGEAVRSLLREGDAADVLLSVATEERADLIVVGNRGMGPKRQRIGNVPNRVAHRAPCSVLIAQTTGTPRERTFDRLLIATDGSATADRAAEVGGRLASDLGTEMLLLHVGDPSRGAEVLARTGARLPGGEAAATRTVSGDPARRIVEVATNEDCDLIVMGNRGMTGLRRFLASVPSAVLAAARSHVLLVKTT